MFGVDENCGHFPKLCFILPLGFEGFVGVDHFAYLFMAEAFLLFRKQHWGSAADFIMDIIYATNCHLFSISSGEFYHQTALCSSSSGKTMWWLHLFGVN